MRVPGVRSAVALYAIVLALATVPQLLAFHTLSEPVSVVLAIPVILLPAALFLAAFAIGRYVALLLPLVGEPLQTLGIRLFGQGPDPRYGQFPMRSLGSQLWETLKFDVVVGLIVAATAVWLAQKLRGRDRMLPTFTIPKTRPFAIAFAVALLFEVAFTFLTFHVHGFLYGSTLVASLAIDAVTITLALLTIVEYSPWVAPLAIFATSAMFVTIVIQPGFTCGDGNCHDFFWPLLRDQFILFAGLAVVSYAAGWWARQPQRTGLAQDAPAPIGVSSRLPHSTHEP